MNPQPSRMEIVPEHNAQRALIVLLEAYEIAAELNLPVWDFAIQLSSFHDLGISDSQLRYLICQQLVEHRLETSSANDTGRIFSRPSFLHFTRESCFVLTEGGRTSARSDSKPEDAVVKRAGKPSIPHYDSSVRTLYFAGEIVKQFRVPAANQELILAAFEEDGWPPHLCDPLPGKSDIPSKRRLSDTIKNLNTHQCPPGIRFRGDGRGTGVYWEPWS